MALRYWVGDSGYWSDTAHWSTTSGGAGGSAVPTSSDDVIFDANSFSTNGHIVTFDTGASSLVTVYAKSIDMSGTNDTFTLIPGNYIGFGTTVFLNLYGNMTLSSNLTVGNRGYLYFYIRADTIFTQNGASLDPSSQRSMFRIPYGFTLTLGGNASVNGISLTNGAFNTSGFNLTTVGINANSTDPKTINISNSTITMINGVTTVNNIDISGSNYTITNTNSLLILSTTGTGRGYTSNQSIFPTVEIPTGGVVTLNGANTFTSLKLAGRLTVASTTTHTIRRFIIAGGQILSSGSGSAGILSITGSTQLVAGTSTNIKDSTITGAGTYYAGTGSTNGGNNTGWVFSDAPKVETLTDNFPGSTVDTAKWTSTTYVTQNTGWVGVSSFGSTRTGVLASKNQYLGQGSFMKFKQSINTGASLTAYFAYASQQYGVTARRNIPDIYVTLTDTTGQFFIKANTNYTSTSFTNSYLYYRMREASGTIYLDGSNDGVAYTNIKSAVASSYGLDTTQLIVRPYFAFESTGVSFVNVGSFNIELEPTAQFTADVTSGNTPLTVNFTDQSNFSPTSWSWDFGDGDTSTSQNPSHAYDAPGTYTVELESSNVSYTRSESKIDYITVSPNVYSRSISGTILFSGSATRSLLAYRSISGTLLFGGGARAAILRDVEAIQDKRYLYKVYEPDGTYIEVWKDVISELSFTNEINTIGSTTTVELARNSDSVGTTTSPLLTEADTVVTTEDDLDLFVITESRNQIGSGSSVDYNNRVDIVVFYGSVEPLLTEDDEPILTEADEEILADIGAPNGRRIFTGFISEINSRYGNSETTIVQLSSFGWDLDQFPITDGANTTVPFLSYDPSDIAKEAIDQFITDSSGFDYLTYTNRDAISINDTGTVVSYTFRVNTYAEVLDKTLELMPSNWYYRVGLGDNIVYYDERSASPTHLFYLGKHLKALDLKGSILDSTNRVLYTGGGDPALYIDTEDIPTDRTRRTLQIMSDSRVTLSASAEVISEGLIEQKNQTNYRTSIEILSVQYDIETINVGDTVGFRNFGNYVDGLIMQIVGLAYSPDSIQLQLDTKPPTINKRLEDIRRNLTVSDNEFVPDAPL